MMTSVFISFILRYRTFAAQQGSPLRLPGKVGAEADPTLLLFQ